MTILMMLGLASFSAFMVLSFENMRAFQANKKREAVCVLLNVLVVASITFVIRLFDMEFKDTRILYLIFSVPISIVFGFQYRGACKGILASLVVLLTAFCWEGLAILLLQLWDYAYTTVAHYVTVFFCAFFVISVSVLLLRRSLRARIDMSVFNCRGTHIVIAVSAVILLIIHLVHTGVETETDAVRTLDYMLLFLSNIVLIGVIVRYVYRKRALQAEQQLVEASRRHVHDLEESYTALQAIRHDYMHTMAPFQLYIDNRDMDGLADYYHTELAEMNRELLHRDQWEKNLHDIQISEIKSMLLYKCSVAAERQVNVVIEAVEPVENLGVSTAVICQVLGILLDNAIEAAEQTEAKQLAIAVLQVEGAVLFVIRNTWNPENLPVDELFELGFSTKANDRGMGLHTVQSYMDKVRGLYLETAFDASDFTQILTVKGG